MHPISARPLLLLLFSLAAIGRPASLAGQPAIGDRPGAPNAVAESTARSGDRPQPSPAELAQRIEELVKADLERQGIPGLSLAVAKEGHPVLAKGFGLANVELGVPATPETVYQIQSMTKSFTATGMMMLVEQGKVGLDDKVSKHLGATSERWKNITVRHLLTHTSGIKDFINEPPPRPGLDNTEILRLDVTEEEVLKAALRRPLNFEPGEQYAYSNTNYHLLAMIIHKVTGHPYGVFLRERIFDPLGMDETRVISLSEIIPRRAAGYRRQQGVLRNGDFIAPTILGYGGGGLRSTVLDLVKWDAAFYTERLLKKSSLDEMWTPAKLNSGKPTAYGFGWGIGVFRGRRCLSHTGVNVTGFNSAICRFVDDRLTVIVLTNCNPANAFGIAQRIAAVYLPGPPPWFGRGDKPSERE